MPEMHFRVRFPNGATVDCYSPSYVIEEYLNEGKNYLVSDFLERTRTALNIAAERVHERYGFSCSSALDQLAAIEQTIDSLSSEQRTRPVQVLEFKKHAPRDARAKAARAEHHTVIVVGAVRLGCR